MSKKNKNQHEPAPKNEDAPSYRHYYISRLPYYRDGRLYAPGEIVTIPATETPARDWQEVTAADAIRAHRENVAPVLVEADVKFDGERPSDMKL